MPRSAGSRYPLLLLSSIHKRTYRPKKTLFRLTVPGDMLLLIVQGDGLLRLGDDIVPLKPELALFLRRSDTVDLMPESGQIEYYVLVLRSVEVGKPRGYWTCTPSEASGTLLPPGRLRSRSIRPMVERLEQIYRGSRSNPGQALSVQLQFQSLLQLVAADSSGQREPERERGGIDRSIAYMHDHFHEKIKLDTLSVIAGLTQTSYSRSFKRQRGVSPIEYLNQIRIDCAKPLLAQKRPIKEVSESVGFGSEYYFSRLFKRTVGLSPASYVQRRQLRIAVATCFGFGDCLRSLGVQPAAVMNGLPYNGQGGDRHGRLVQLQMQRIRQARPDLIVTDCRHQPYYEELKQIAPIVVLPFTSDWRDNHRRIAELAGREKEAEQNFRQVEQEIRDARLLLSSPEAGKTFSFMRLYSRKIRVQGTTDHPMNVLLYAELGLKPGSGVPSDSQYREFDLRRMPPFDTDYMYIHPIEKPDRDVPLFASQQQDAFRGGMQFRPVSNWIRKSWSPLGQRQIIDELLRGTGSPGTTAGEAMGRAARTESSARRFSIT
ncbi:helix-turn-helix domain-containing protein [Paenibacillus mesophilus]|uniref:AraC family transcriptional regulator n=1 Tax=Paenibacillus mesophilus TaxID=2582849 RepID=UPI00110EB810|nr:AraC family transcriptional regulator [Paenibacillus mesophilus]TMV45798.1 helix-turn-helix domain-containing protein [Paenibacillus mesophilus]